MGHYGATARIFALLVAATAWTGLCVQLADSMERAGTVVLALWTMVRFFTILTNLAVALFFTVLAAGRLRDGAPRVLGGLTLAILLVGIVNALLLTGLQELTGRALISDRILHYATPVLVALYWLLFAPKGGLRPGDPLIWAAYPLAYFLYALARGAMDGHYPYPFMNVTALGWIQTLINAFAIAAAFVISGWGLVLLDRRLGETDSSGRSS